MRRLFIGILIHCSCTLLAQNLNVLNAPVPPSPAAYAITKVADMPVSHYTGSADISIPLFQLSGSDLSLPINLIYNANGFKVNETPGWVGYGWSLSSSGAISRTIQDAPDNFAFGYYRDAMDTYYSPSGKPKFNECYGVTGLNSSAYTFYQLLNSGASGQPTFYDTEPDLYSYALPGGGSGKFVIDRNGRVRALPKTRTKIELVTTGGGIDDFEFAVFDEMGTQYMFSSFERIQSIIQSTTFTMHGQSRLGELQPKNSWYINQIRSAGARETISFAYLPETTTYRSPDSQSKGFLILPPQPGDSVGIDYNETDYTSYTNNTVSGLRLSSINFKGYTIHFIADNTQRIDLAGSHRLKQIVVLHNMDTIKNYRFYHSYFLNSSSAPEYLRLDSLVEFGQRGVRMPAHKFRYYEVLNGPAKNSYSVDHWGYFNGAYNNTLLPRYFRPSISYAPGIEYFINFIGANRNPHFESTRHGMLEQITYPTGGVTKFEYEPNSYSRFGTEYQQIEESTAVFINPTLTGNTQEGLNYVDDEFFTLTQDTTYLWVDAISTCSDPGGGLPADCGIIITGTNVSYSQQLINESTTALFKLGPGSYRLRASISIYRTDVIGATIKWLRKGNLLVNKTGPGLRIKSIQNCESPISPPVSVRKFSYELSPGVSSGLLHDKLRYDYDLSAINNMQSGTLSSSCLNNNYSYTLRVLESNSLNSFVNQGTLIGYDRVQEAWVTSPGDTQTPIGRTVYEFFNQFSVSNQTFGGIPTAMDGSLNLPITAYEGLSGKPKSQKIYHQNGSLLKENAYAYTISPIDSIVGFQAAPRVRENCTKCDFSFRQYWHLSFAIEGTSTLTHTYQNPSEYLTEESTQEYLYRSGLTDRDSYYILRKTNVRNSEGYLRTYEIRYPFDFTNPPGSTILTQMVARNKLVPILQIQTYSKDNKIYEGRLLNYEIDFVDGSIRLKRYYDLENLPITYSAGTMIADIHTPPSVFVQKASYQYDGLGNLSMIEKKDDLKQSFLWSNSTIPEMIAECINCSPGQFFFDGYEYEGGNLDAQAHTGNFSRNSNFTFSPPSGITIVSNSKLSYWYWSNSKWNFKEVNYSGGSLLIQDGTKIDDLRITPPGAQLTTYTHLPGIGVSSVSDKSQLAQYFEYDPFNRLKVMRDENKNIVKAMTYNFKK